MFEQGNEIFDVIWSSVFAYLIIGLPIFVSMSPGCLAAKEFSTFRLQQFELHGTSYGTSGSVLNLETRILPGSPIVTSPRRCYVVKLMDLTVGMYRDLLKHSVAGILIIVPADLSDISETTKEQIQDLESVMLEEATSVPVYFVKEDDDVLQLYSTVKSNADILGPTSTGFETLIHHIQGNGVQLVSSLGTSKAVTDAQITTIQGTLVGSKTTNNYPILICSHYDSMSPAAELSFGGDANGSGSVALLELARLFSHLYSGRGSSGKSGRQYSSLLFLLSGGGHFNYQGTQKYLEDQIESLDHSDLQDTRLALCLDSLSGNKNELFIHVSRSIREGTITSLLDTKENIDVDDLVIKTHVIAEALAASIYNVSGNGPAFSGSLAVSKTSVSSMLDFIVSEPRSAQLLASKNNKFVQSLRSALARFTHETSLFYMKPDKRDANLVFYDSTAGTITAYDVKPAVFDLILSIAVAAYIAVIYTALKNFHILFDKVSINRQEVNSNGLNGNNVTHGKGTKVQ
ncbi:unnamed protein product [Allacma fusca]|uniref:BOS complex subunit NCLN n=1 Tax=Allacma fusca TaxID=39272 RepID=A0A8J2LSM6_9HEXA|nr:unnamed protein product [Allacma fusca]